MVFLASQDAPEVMGVTQSVSQETLANLIDVTLVSEDTCCRLDWKTYWPKNIAFKKLLTNWPTEIWKTENRDLNALKENDKKWMKKAFFSHFKFR